MYNHNADRKPTETKFDAMYRGEVINVLDPLHVGRIQVRVFGIFDGVQDEALPWALYSDPLMGGGNGYGGFFVPNVSDHVWVFFENGNHLQPVYFAGAPSAIHFPDERITSSHEQSRGAISYPQNKVFVTKGGHSIEMDDTPGNMRVSIIHKSGTQYTIFDNGDTYEHVVGDVVRLIDGNVNETIAGTLTQSVSGNVTETYSASQTTNITSNKTENIGGSYTSSTSGTVTISGATVNLN
ncbi:MAG: phage baseplate assembly protein V [Thiomicrorhabdus sp.]|jgi:uncharacterized protein involved in type VI secretion and phage assembly|nr:phage baseplate assembly protein V [Thiomicrorhabdus sp.]